MAYRADRQRASSVAVRVRRTRYDLSGEVLATAAAPHGAGRVPLQPRSLSPAWSRPRRRAPHRRSTLHSPHLSTHRPCTCLSAPHIICVCSHLRVRASVLSRRPLAEKQRKVDPNMYWSEYADKWKNLSDDEKAAKRLELVAMQATLSLALPLDRLLFVLLLHFVGLLKVPFPNAFCPRPNESLPESLVHTAGRHGSFESSARCHVQSAAWTADRSVL